MCEGTRGMLKSGWHFSWWWRRQRRRSTWEM